MSISRWTAAWESRTSASSARRVPTSSSPDRASSRTRIPSPPTASSPKPFGDAAFLGRRSQRRQAGRAQDSTTSTDKPGPRGHPAASGGRRRRSRASPGSSGPRPGKRDEPGTGARAGRARARHHLPEPGRWGRPRARRRDRRRGLARAAGRAARRGERDRGRRRARARSNVVRDPRSRARTTGARRRAWTPSSRRGSPASSPARSTRTQDTAAGWSGCARQGSRPSSSTRSRPGSRTRPGGRGPHSARPFVTYKVAVTLDGRVTLPGGRWVSGEESRRARARAACGFRRRSGRDGDGARGRSEAGRARRGRGSASRVASRSAGGRSRRSPSCSSVRARSTGSSAASADEGVQSLLLEGGPTLATAFLERDLIDKLLVFVAPVIGGDGPRFLAALSASVPLFRLNARPVGADVLLDRLHP